MANLKAIRQRIKSVQNTQKITRAMQMVAAARVRRAQTRTMAARPFTRKVVELIQQVVHEANPVDLQDLPLLRERPIKTVGLLILTSDRGLCGSYNTNIIKETVKRIRDLKAEGKRIALITIGLKSTGFFKRLKDDQVERLKQFTNLPAIPTYETAKLIAEFASESYISGKVDAVEIIGTRFVNMSKQEVRRVKFLPVDLPEGKDHNPLSAETIFEPTILELMEMELLPKYIDNVIYQALLEASASELAARMSAMSNATTNAKDLIQALTLVYNKARQSDITQQLLEVVGGAEALKS